MIPEVLQRLTCQALLADDLAVQFQCLQSVFAKSIILREFFYSHVAIKFVYRGPVLSLLLSLAHGLTPMQPCSLPLFTLSFRRVDGGKAAASSPS